MAESENPYRVPETDAPAMASTDPSTPFPSYAFVLGIVDLVFCGLRLPLVLLGLLALSAIGHDNPLFATAIGEVVTGAGIVFFGITANVLLLRKSARAVPFGVASVLCTVASVGVGLWQLGIQLPDNADEAQRIGFMIGASFSVLFRLGLLGAYVTALVMVSSWARANRANGPDGPAPEEPALLGGDR